MRARQRRVHVGRPAQQTAHANGAGDQLVKLDHEVHGVFNSEFGYCSMQIIFYVVLSKQNIQATGVEIMYDKSSEFRYSAESHAMFSILHVLPSPHLIMPKTEQPFFYKRIGHLVVGTVDNSTSISPEIFHKSSSYDTIFFRTYNTVFNLPLSQEKQALHTTHKND